MKENLLRFLNKIGAMKQIKEKFDEYLKNIDEKGNEFINSSLVLPLQYDYTMFTEDFRKNLNVVWPRGFKHRHPFHSRFTRWISYYQSTALWAIPTESHSGWHKLRAGNIIPAISNAIRTNSFRLSFHEAAIDGQL